MEKLGNKFDGIYKFLKRRIIWGSWIGILMSLVLDILPFPYFFNWIEEIFSFDLGNLLSIALMIWTFVTALLVYYMGRIKDKFFGVNLRDALQFDENQQEFYNEIKNAGILFLGELLVLIISAILEYPITMVVLNFLLVFFMLYAFSLIYYYGSEERISDIIDKRYGGTLDTLKGKNEEDVVKELSENYLFRQMIAGMDYKSEKEAKQLLEWLMKVSKEEQWEEYKHVIKQLVKLILKSSEEGNDVFDVVQKWFANERTCIECKCEILKGLIKVGGKAAMDCSLTLMCIVRDDTERRKLMIEFMACNDVMRKGVGQDYRALYTDKVYRRIGEFQDWEIRHYNLVEEAFEREVFE